MEAGSGYISRWGPICMLLEDAFTHFVYKYVSEERMIVGRLEPLKPLYKICCCRNIVCKSLR